ncbi:MAG: hypothetical protein II840_05335 [Kiritimatiellae bacterium]|nr:hypothetical protein [Kiritimatiellia bacterium]
MIAPSEKVVKPPKAKRGKFTIWLVALMIAAAMGIVAFCLLKTGDAKDAPEKPVKQSKIAKQAPVAAKQPEETVVEGSSVPAEPEFTDGRTSAWSKKFSKDSKWSATTNTLGEVVEVVLDGGKVHKRRSLSRPPLFDGQVDQAIAMVVALDPNEPIPPFPVRKFSDKEIRAALEREIVIDPNEPAEIQLKKANVINAREEVKRLMDSGMTFEQIINQARREQNENVDMRREVQASIKEMLDAGDAKGAEEYRQRANEILRQQGIEEIPSVNEKE